MVASVIIPVWNGALVLPDCLDAIYAHSGDDLLEVICVDNASQDESAALIAERFPQVHLIRHVANLGFAGGINAGVEAAAGEVFVLLNQDCMVQPGWLTALGRALDTNSEFGIVGCTILNADGTLNHAGAALRRPDAYGIHLTETSSIRPRRVECVTGAAVAIRRETWDGVGHFDEGYYPGYYEDTDYCYRARRRGYEIGYVPDARVVHLFSGREWQADPIRHTANQHRARYRFVCKHFDEAETYAFFKAEYEAIDCEDSYDQVMGRTIAARDTLRGLVDILERRRVDLAERPASSHRRHLEIGFAQVLRRSFAVAERMAQVELADPPLEEWDAANQRLEQALGALLSADLDLAAAQTGALEQLKQLQRREHDLLARIHFREPDASESESTLRRMFRLLVLRPLSFLIGRDYLLHSELAAVHVMRMDQIVHQLEQMDQIYRSRLASHNTHMEQLKRLCSDKVEQKDWLWRYRHEQLQRRVKLLETLTDYDYR
jgi:GT2 family glycosyltransferase